MLNFDPSGQPQILVVMAIAPRIGRMSYLSSGETAGGVK